ncbi:uncharacterized protein LOC130447573 isoform X8 [Diorhabda sublineata]|uniref:uncharacterized protein LOC130447573 isoform X8 n=1 Tax=Diorhabda sublineata TaxID=1163346 RepID=UPI0024E109F6|nr:uncharacterized protein LOC130447573 isoform X8 [Diorhabda sublineata]
MSSKCYYNCGSSDISKCIFGCETCTAQVLKRNGLQDDTCWSYYGPLPNCCCQTCKRQMDLLWHRRNCINFRQYRDVSFKCRPSSEPPCNNYQQLPVCKGGCRICGTCIPCIFQQKYTMDQCCQKSDRNILKESKSVGSLSLTLTLDYSTSSDDLRPGGNKPVDDCICEDKNGRIARRGVLRPPGARKKNEDIKQEVHFVPCSKLKKRNNFDDNSTLNKKNNLNRSRKHKSPIVLSKIKLNYCTCDESLPSDSLEKMNTQADETMLDKEEKNNRRRSSKDNNSLNDESFCNCSSESEEKLREPKYSKQKEYFKQNNGEDCCECSSDSEEQLRKSKYSKQNHKLGYQKGGKFLLHSNESDSSFDERKNTKYVSDKTGNYETDNEFESDDEYETSDEDEEFRPSPSTLIDDVPFCLRKRIKPVKEKGKKGSFMKQLFNKIKESTENRFVDSFCKCDEENIATNEYEDDDYFEDDTFQTKQCCSLVLSCDSSICLDDDQAECSLIDDS